MPFRFRMYLADGEREGSDYDRIFEVEELNQPFARFLKSVLEDQRRCSARCFWSRR